VFAVFKFERENEEEIHMVFKGSREDYIPNVKFLHKTIWEKSKIMRKIHLKIVKNYDENSQNLTGTPKNSLKISSKIEISLGEAYRQ